MSAACLVATDLTALRLLADGVDEAWSAPAPDDPDHPTPLRDLAAAAADWIVERLPARRIDTLCLDVDEARCLWIAAPTREAAVISAAVRQRRAEWGDDDGAGDLVQPLVEPRPSRKGEPDASDAFAAVLETPDAATKLLLDALDSRGVRVGEALSLWHALASRAGDELTCVVASDRPSRLIWAWGDEGGLVAAGMCRRPEAAGGDGAAAGRLTLDWLTWGAQLGRTPARCITLGELSAVGDEVRTRWPNVAIENAESDDPVRELLLTPAIAPGADNPRRSTPTLTRRPSRSHRRVYRLAALGVALAAVGVAGLGLRAQRAAAGYRDARAELISESRELVRSVAPGSETNPDLVSVLQSHFAQLQRDQPPLPVPPVPKPIFAELKRLLEGAVPIEGVTVNRISLEDRAGSAQFRISTYADGEQLMTLLDTPALSGAEHPIDWSERVTGSTPNLVIRLTGLWK